LEKQQAVEKERTRIASDMHDDWIRFIYHPFLSEKVNGMFQPGKQDDIEKMQLTSNELVSTDE